MLFFAETPSDPEDAKFISEKLRDYLDVLKILDGINLENSAEEKLEDEIERSGTCRADIIAGLTCIRSRLDALKNEPAVPPTSPGPGSSKDLAP